MGASHAQPFSKLEIGLSGSYTSQESKIYSERWNLTSAKSFQVRTPFYIGVAGVNIDVFDYIAKKDPAADFSSINFSSYLSVKIIEYKNFSTISGLLVGIQKTKAEESGFEFNPEERELFFGINIEPQIRISNLILFGDIQYRKVFNFYRQNILLVGLGARFRLPLSQKAINFID